LSIAQIQFHLLGGKIPENSGSFILNGSIFNQGAILEVLQNGEFILAFKYS